MEHLKRTLAQFDMKLTDNQLAQFEKYQRAILDWNESVNLTSITDPDEWITRITGESLNTDYFCDYLDAKYADIYNL